MLCIVEQPNRDNKLQLVDRREHRLNDERIFFYPNKKDVTKDILPNYKDGTYIQ